MTRDPVGSPAQTAEEHNLRLMSQARSYHRWIYEQLKGHLSGGRLLEVGAGVGNLTKHLIAGGHRVTCTDINPRNLAELVAACPGARVLLDDIGRTTLDERFNTIVCVNVLEHVADDLHGLRNLRRLLDHDGKLLLLVPAEPWAYGVIDEADGHYRRYSRRALRAGLLAAGFEVLAMRYTNVLGLVGWWWQGRVLRRRIHGAGSLRWFDRLVPVLSAVERVVAPPIGLSILAVARPAGVPAQASAGSGTGESRGTAG